MIHIKTISHEEWDQLYRKPFIFFGFHPCLSGSSNRCAAVATFEDGICEYQQIPKMRGAYQQFFQKLLQKYRGAPVEILSQRTQRILEEFEYESTHTMVYLYLKGTSDEIQRWSTELRSPQKLISEDNPIQIYKDCKVL